MKPEAHVQRIALLLVALLIGSVASKDWIVQIDRLESRWLRMYLGESRYSNLNNDVEQTLGSSYPSSSLSEPFIPPMVHLTPEMELVVDWIEKCADLLDRAIRRIVRRVELLLLFGPLGLTGLILFMADASLSRKIRQHGFDYSSPLMHRSSLQMIRMLILAMVIMIMIPLPLPPQWIPLHFCLLAACVWTNIAHMPKKI
jgi:Domain of unknown function (DUF4400)